MPTPVTAAKPAPAEQKQPETPARTEPPVTPPQPQAAETKPAPQPAPAPVQEPPKPEVKPETKPAPAAAPAEEVKMDLPATEEKLVEGAIVGMTPDVKPPVEVKRVNPSIPQTATRLNLHGKVVCRILISYTGAVEKVQVVSADSPRVREIFTESARSALMQWQFKPAEKNGIKVRVWKTITLAF